MRTRAARKPTKYVIFNDKTAGTTGNTVLVISPVSPDRTCRRYARVVPPQRFPSYILRLYFIRLASLIFPQAKRPIEVKLQRDKNIDILFVRNDRSLSTGNTLLHVGDGISCRALMADSYRPPAITPLAFRNLPVSHRKTVSHFSTSRAGLYLRCTRSIVNRYRQKSNGRLLLENSRET